jgi:hypothetical protein
MGQPNAAHVDAAALLSIADRYEVAGELIDTAVRTHLSCLAFDGATAGRGHVAAGNALRCQLEDVADRMRRWSRAAAEIAAALRQSADRYAEADVRSSGRLG